MEQRSPLTVEAAGLTFRNPVLLAAGTAAFGREVSSVIELARLGGIVTKAVSPRPRHGAPAPRVAEFESGMINAVGLANPGLDDVLRHDIPWLALHSDGARVIVNVVGDTVEDYGVVVGELDGKSGVHAFELNVSCPNVRAGGAEFGADATSLEQVVRSARGVTSMPVFAKLSPTLPNVAESARVAVDAGADGITLVNTIPGMIINLETRRPALGFGKGGVSGPGLLPVGVLATANVRRAVSVPIIGVGGISSGEDALQYLIAGASLVAIGTAAMKDPGAPSRIVRELASWCDGHNVRAISEIVGTLNWYQ